MAAALISLVFAAPLIYLALRVARSGLLGEVLASGRTLDPLATTLGLAAVVSASAAVLGTALAWLIVRCDLPGRRVFLVVAALPLVFPSFVAAGALVEALAPNGQVTALIEPLGLEVARPEGFGWAWLILTLFTYPYVYLPVAARLTAVSTSCEEAGLMLGRSQHQVFRTVVVPQIRRAAGAGALLVFLYTLSEFGAVVLLRVNTLTRAIYSNRLINQPLSLTLALILAVVALVVVAGERAVAARADDGPVARGRPPKPVALGRWRWPAAAAAGALVVATMVVPCVVLATWVLRGARASGRAALALDLSDLATSSANTAVVSVAAAITATVVVLPIALAVGRYRSRVGDAAQALVTTGFALPGLVIALSLITWTLASELGAAFYQTLPLLVGAYVVHFGAQAVRAARAAVAMSPERLSEATRMLGASRVRRWGRVELPLMAPGLAAGAGLVMLSTMKELPVTLLLSPPGFSTLATGVWSRYEEQFLAEAGVSALLLVALSALLTWLLVLRHSRPTIS